MDYLDVFDDEPGSFLAVSSSATSSLQCQAVASVAASREALNSKDSEAVTVHGPKGRFERPKPLAGVKVNSRGSAVERRAWNMAMQIHRSKIKQAKTEQDVIDLLTSLQKRARSDSGIKMVRGQRGGLFTKGGLIRHSVCRMKSKGNRFTSRWSMSDFLIAAFGADRKRGKRIKARASAALSLGAAPSTLSYMRSVVAGSVLARQASVLARIYLLTKMQKPLVTCLREGFDETSQIITVKGEVGSWQVCVVRHSLFVAWPPSCPGEAPRLLKMQIAPWLPSIQTMI